MRRSRLFDMEVGSLYQGGEDQQLIGCCRGVRDGGKEL